MKRLTLILIAIALIAGCATKTSVLRSLELGMNKNQVVEVAGEPRVVRGAMVNSFGQSIEVWEYALATPNEDSAGTLIGKGVITVATLGLAAGSFSPKKKGYWIIFSDSRLARWGEAGDWDSAKRQIIDVQFNSSPKLH